MFDLGFWEIALIVVIGLLVLGPEKLPRAARTVGLWVGKARRTLAEVKRDIDRELDASELKELTNVKEELTDTKKIFEEAASDLNKQVEKDYETIAVKPQFETPATEPKKETASKDPSVGGESKVAT